MVPKIEAIIILLSYGKFCTLRRCRNGIGRSGLTGWGGCGEAVFKTGDMEN